VEAQAADGGCRLDRGIERPADIDVGHTRLNLAVLFGAGWVEPFRLAYEAETGRAVDPSWDLHAIASCNDSWPGLSIPRV
jgi:hypothetical protein